MRRRVGLCAVLCAGVVMLVSASAEATTYAPINQPGPPLTVPLAQLQASLVCEPSVAHAAVEPVLLNPATGVTAAENYSWNWEPALTKLGIPWCAYTAPYSTLGNIETSGEYLVYAIRTMYAMAGRKIAVMGHSQGGMSMRWPLRWWPDTRHMVEDVIGFSGSNHGTTVISSADCLGGCPAADWQQGAGSHFITALNSDDETFPGISYTEIWTHTDEVVQPNGDAATASAALHTGGGQITDIATQQLCPADVYEHLSIGTVDPVAYDLAIDALTHPGPADPARIPSSVCSETYMPGVNLANLNTALQILQAAPGLGSVTAGGLAHTTTGAPELSAEPPLECYVTATCSGPDAPTLDVQIIHAPRRILRGRAVRVSVRIRTLEGSAMAAVAGVSVRLDGHQRTTGPGGNASFRLRFRRRGAYRLTATLAGTNSASQSFHVVRR